MTYDTLIGQTVTTVRGSSRRTRSGILISAEPDPDYDEGAHRALILTRSGDYTLDQVLRDVRWESLITDSTMTLADIATLLNAHDGWSFVIRNNLTRINLLDMESDPAPLRPLDCLYMVSAHQNADQDNGGFVDMPDEPADPKRIMLVMAHPREQLYLLYGVATGNRVVMDLRHTRVHRLFQTTSVDWCTERVDALGSVMDYMRQSYVDAQREDRARATRPNHIFPRGSDLDPETVGFTDADTYNPAATPVAANHF
jgi:hypothetical protein